MKKKIIFIGILLGCCMWATAQKKITLQAHKPYSTEVRLCDQDKTDDNFLLNLPLTFSITDNNILIVMVGNDIALDYEQSVWMFSEKMSLADLMKKNCHVSATGIFKNKNTICDMVLLSSGTMTLYRTFDDGYEVIKKNAKPIFFKIPNPISNKPLTFSLQFYVAKPNPKFPYNFIAKCKPVEFELIIK